jgi:hypothetical protein
MQCQYCVGTPGIGKSFFAFALMHWLMKEQVTHTIVYEFQSQRFKLSENGSVYQGGGRDFEDTLRDPSAW